MCTIRPYFLLPCPPPPTPPTLEEQCYHKASQQQQQKKNESKADNQVILDTQEPRRQVNDPPLLTIAP